MKQRFCISLVTEQHKEEVRCDLRIGEDKIVLELYTKKKSGHVVVKSRCPRTPIRLKFQLPGLINTQ